MTSSGKDESIDKLRELNPEMFLKKDKIKDKQDEDLIENQKTVETMDIKAHHQFSFIPNRKVFANREIMDTLVKSMIDAEYVFKK